MLASVNAIIVFAAITAAIVLSELPFWKFVRKELPVALLSAAVLVGITRLAFSDLNAAHLLLTVLSALLLAARPMWRRLWA